jgi:hypothetical protein
VHFDGELDLERMRRERHTRLVGEMRSVGMGHEELADGDILEPGVVVSVEATVDDVLGSETVLVTPAGHELVTTLPHPLG